MHSPCLIHELTIPAQDLSRIELIPFPKPEILAKQAILVPDLEMIPLRVSISNLPLCSQLTGMERCGHPVQCSALFVLLFQLFCNIHPVTDMRLILFVEVNFVLLCGHYFARFFAVAVSIQEVLEPGLHGSVVLFQPAALW